MTHESEEEAYAYAYNDGHSGSRKNEPYKPNPTTKEGADFKKIYKQRAESADKEFCCLHFAFISLSFRPSSLKESEIC